MATRREKDDVDELADLAHALARTARRAKSTGKKQKAPRAAAASPAPAAAVTPSRARLAPAAVSPTPAAPPASTARASTPASRPATPSAVPVRPTIPPPAASHKERPARAARPPARSARDVLEQAAGAADLDELRARVAVCEACSLCQTRTQTVFMDGAAVRGVLFVGEAPGAEEDKTGLPFVGRSGQLLTDIITKGMGIPRPEVAIANVLKCRPPENRDPTPAEKSICTPWLDRQIALIDPQVIIPLGRHAANHVLGTEDATMGSLRQRIHDKGGRKIVPTFHPSYLLRSPGEKKECWKDIQLAMGILGLKGPKTL